MLSESHLRAHTAVEQEGNVLHAALGRVAKQCPDKYHHDISISSVLLQVCTKDSFASTRWAFLLDDIGQQLNVLAVLVTR